MEVVVTGAAQYNQVFHLLIPTEPFIGSVVHLQVSWTIAELTPIISEVQSLLTLILPSIRFDILLICRLIH
jgi:hypothetical protein